MQNWRRKAQQPNIKIRAQNLPTTPKSKIFQLQLVNNA